MTSPRWRGVAPMDRRTFVRRMSALAAATWAAPTLGPRAREAWARTADTARRPGGTTLERTIVPIGEGPYFRLGFGPGWPIEVRADLAEPKRGRETRRVALAAFLHVTDYQLADAQSPARVEFLDRFSDPPTTPVPFDAAQRPQEAVMCQVVESLNLRARALRRAPITGRQVDFAISTGDNIDSKQANELRWFITLMDGGDLAANSGDPDVFEGVQGFEDPLYYDEHYWHPREATAPRSPDVYKTGYGFPELPGFLAAAITPFTSVGVGLPWYSVYGNHDAFVQGNAPGMPQWDAIARGGTKVLMPGMAPGDFYRAFESGDPAAAAAFGSPAAARPVTPDEERRHISPKEYIEAHLASPTSPIGHGFTEDNLDAETLYYRFEVAPGIRGLTLDTTGAATSEGSIDQTQLDWLEQELVAVHSRYFDGNGEVVRTGNDDQLVVVFSHHRPSSMQPIQGPDQQGNLEQRYGGDTVVELLQRFPNVILWVNGHSHVNRIVLHGHDDPVRGFWDLTTAAQCDPPQQARILEVVDNRDGTLSIFTTVIDHAATPDTDPGRLDVLGLASFGRELSYNDFQQDPLAATGAPTDLNTELLVLAPFDTAGTGGDGDPQPAPSPSPLPSGGPGLPDTGGGVAASAALALLGGAVALRQRGQRSSATEGSNP